MLECDSKKAHQKMFSKEIEPCVQHLLTILNEKGETYMICLTID